MRFSLLTLFPDVIQPYVSASIIGRAQAAGIVRVEALNPRDFSTDPHRKVDDAPYGGGSGMVLSCQPFEAAYASLGPLEEPARVLMTSPAGRTIDQAFVHELSQCRHVVLFCGHYEGFDERIHTLIPRLERVSLGDFVLTGGELPALCLVDAVTRLLPGAVQKADSVVEDAFFDPSRPRLDYPHYTRPAEYKGLVVPDVLRSGDHGAIARWRRRQALWLTWQLRPDLLTPETLNKDEQRWLAEFQDG